MTDVYLGDDKDEKASLALQIVFIVGICIITIVFGLFPLFCKVCKNSTKFLGIANSFSGGIFMGIAFFHLFPEVKKL
jgi:threonine/homoserine/homoserine lactone efflux protein